MNSALSKSDARARRAQNVAQYQPKATRPLTPVRQTVVDMRLRKLTAKVLDELKRPDAIPSAVIYAALVEAAAK
jgi:hypothetical protein